MTRLKKLRNSLSRCPIVKFGDYSYFVHSITDGLPQGDPEVLVEVIDEIIRIGNFNCNKIVTVEAMGFPIAALLSVKTGIPYVFIRKRHYGLEGEISVQQVTGYSEKKLYINNINQGDKVIFVDDVISTGGSLRAIVKALKNLGAEIKDIIIVFEKTRKKREIEEELGVKIKTLMGVDVVDGKVVEVPL